MSNPVFLKKNKKNIIENKACVSLRFISYEQDTNARTDRQTWIGAIITQAFLPFNINNGIQVMAQDTKPVTKKGEITLTFVCCSIFKHICTKYYQSIPRRVQQNIDIIFVTKSMVVADCISNPSLASEAN